jgi:hypothetical protein
MNFCSERLSVFLGAAFFLDFCAGFGASDDGCGGGELGAGLGESTASAAGGMSMNKANAPVTSKTGSRNGARMISLPAA